MIYRIEDCEGMPSPSFGMQSDLAAVKRFRKDHNDCGCTLHRLSDDKRGWHQIADAEPEEVEISGETLLALPLNERQAITLYTAICVAINSAHAHGMPSLVNALVEIRKGLRGGIIHIWPDLNETVSKMDGERPK